MNEFYYPSRQILENISEIKDQTFKGLMSWDHMDFEIDRIVKKDQPSLVEMTLKAIEILKRNPKGFYLLVEGGKIDHGKAIN